MVDTKYYCDRCGVRITFDRSEIRPKCGPLRRSHPSVDLCPECAGEMVEFLQPRGTAVTAAPKVARY